MFDDTTVTAYREGTFTIEVAPPWLMAIRERRAKGTDWHAAIRQVLPCIVSHVLVGDEYWPHGEMRAHATPDGGCYVEIGEGEGIFAEIWVARAAEWLPFSTTYIEPFMLTRATVHQADKIDRLGNALIAFARHGEGRHIDRLTGESRIDQREDEESRKLRASAKTLSTCK